MGDLPFCFYRKGLSCYVTPRITAKTWPNQHQNKLGAINRGESHGSRCTVHHWLHCVLGTDLKRKQQPSSQSHSDRDAQLISRLDFHWLGGGVAMGRHRQLRKLMIEESKIWPRRL